MERALDRRASKRQNEVKNLTKKKEGQRRRRSFVKFPAGVKELTKANRSLSRGRGTLPRGNKDETKNKGKQGYKFNPKRQINLNFGAEETTFSANKKRPIAIDGSNIAIEHGMYILNNN